MKVPTERLMDEWTSQIQASGTKRLSARALLRTFGAERRGKNVNARIVQWLGERAPPNSACAAWKRWNACGSSTSSGVA